MLQNNRSLVSIVVPCYNEQDVFPLLVAALGTLMERLEPQFRFEVVLVNDGSKDATWSLIESLAKRDSRYVGVCLSRNFGHQAALTAGYDVAKGEAIVSIDADLQDPLEVIDQMLAQWNQGSKIVFAVRTSRAGETKFKLITAAAFYRTMQLLGARHVRLDSGDFRLMDRAALEVFKSLRETHRFVRGMVSWMGFKTSDVFYRREERKAGETKYPLRKMLKLSVDAAISSSMMPLRFAYIFALCVGAVVVSYLGLVMIRYFLFGIELVPGWTSLILAIVALGCANLVALGIMGEYIGRIYEQSKGRPLYIVSQSQNLSTSEEDAGRSHGSHVTAA